MIILLVVLSTPRINRINDILHNWKYFQSTLFSINNECLLKYNLFTAEDYQTLEYAKIAHKNSSTAQKRKAVVINIYSGMSKRGPGGQKKYIDPNKNDGAENVKGLNA